MNDNFFDYCERNIPGCQDAPVLGQGGICGVGQQQNHPDGMYHADVYDVTTGNDIVGRCVYDESHPANCATTGSNFLETGIKVRCSPPYIWIRGRCSNAIIMLFAEDCLLGEVGHRQF